MQSSVKRWRRQKVLQTQLGKKAKIVTWTRIYVAPTYLKDDVPYVVVMVEDAEKQRAYGQLVDYTESDLQPGREVMATLRKIGDSDPESIVAYGVKYRPT